MVVGGIPLTHTHNALPRWCLCDRHHPGVCGRALDVRGCGCVGDGLLQRRDDRRKRTHERKAGPAE